jgi:hypothetical protein
MDLNLIQRERERERERGGKKEKARADVELMNYGVSSSAAGA